MVSEQDTLLDEIEAYLIRSGYSPARFGKLAANNSDLVGRLRKGGEVKRATARRIREWMAQNPDRKPYDRVPK